MSNCTYPGCMMGGLGCDRESRCIAEESGVPYPTPTAEEIAGCWPPSEAMEFLSRNSVRPGGAF